MNHEQRTVKYAIRYTRIENPIIYVPIRHLYICRERSTNQPFLCKTNPIPEKPKMNTNIFITKDYENEPPSGPKKQTQTNPISKASAVADSKGGNASTGKKYRM